MYDVNFPTPEIRFVVGGSEGLLRVLTRRDNVPDSDVERVIATRSRELRKWLSAVAGEFKPRNGMPVKWKGVCRVNAATVLADFVDDLLRRTWLGIPIEFVSQADADELFAQIQAEGIDAEHTRGNSTEIPYYNNNGELICRIDLKPVVTSPIAADIPNAKSPGDMTITPPGKAPKDDKLTCPVQIGRADECVHVLGQKLPTLLAREYKVIRSLVQVFPLGLGRDDLSNDSKVTNAPAVLRKLRKQTCWKDVVHMPGKPGQGGYRLKCPGS